MLIQGIVEKNNLKLRSGAQDGDIICVTNHLGDSGIGLQILLGNIDHKNNDYFLNKHNRPEAPLEEGRWLSSFQSVHSMIDVSDGVSSDLAHMCRQSNARGVVDTSKIPVSDEAAAVFKEGRLNQDETSLCAGEDYCLSACRGCAVFP